MPTFDKAVICKECGCGLFTVDFTNRGLRFRCRDCAEEYDVMQLPRMARED